MQLFFWNVVFFFIHYLSSIDSKIYHKDIVPEVWTMNYCRCWLARRLASSWRLTTRKLCRLKISNYFWILMIALYWNAFCTVRKVIWTWKAESFFPKFTWLDIIYCYGRRSRRFGKVRLSGIFGFHLKLSWIFLIHISRNLIGCFEKSRVFCCQNCVEKCII